MRFVVLSIGLMLAWSAGAQKVPTKERLYLIPGTGADHRLFDALDLSDFDTLHIKLPIARRRESMSAYAARVAHGQIDTSQSFSILGVSLGGMVAVELAELLQPEHVVIVASAKTRDALPQSLRMGKQLPFYRLIGGRTMRWFTRRAQPKIEPMEPLQRDLFFSMLYNKDPKFVQRAIGLISRWDRQTAPPGIVHIHGQLDRTLPFALVCADIDVPGEGHMVTYSKPEVIEEVLVELRK